VRRREVEIFAPFSPSLVFSPLFSHRRRFRFRFRRLNRRRRRVLLPPLLHAHESIVFFPRLVPLHPLPTICFCPAVLRDEHRGGKVRQSRGGHETQNAPALSVGFLVSSTRTNEKKE
jgi:hypothetical protein